MDSVLQKQLDEMSEIELKEVIRREFQRRLVRYTMTKDYFEKKYNMDFDNFEKLNIVKKQNYSFEVESDAQKWELALDGIITVKKKLKELLGAN